MPTPKPQSIGINRGGKRGPGEIDQAAYCRPTDRVTRTDRVSGREREKQQWNSQGNGDRLGHSTVMAATVVGFAANQPG